MAQSFATYDPAEVHISLDGNPITGFADGTFVEIAFDDQQWNKTTGADGHTARSKTNNYGVELIVKDSLGRTVWSAQNAWVQQMPNQAFSKQSENREWIIDCDALFGTIGGNQQAAT